MKYYRHGDVVVQTLDKLPDAFKGFERKKVKAAVLALGEVTGHSHKILPVDQAEIFVYVEPGKEMDPELSTMAIEVVGGKGLLVHEEHAPILLEEGIHWRGMKVQYNPFNGAIENVRD